MSRILSVMPAKPGQWAVLGKYVPGKPGTGYSVHPVIAWALVETTEGDRLFDPTEDFDNPYRRVMAMIHTEGGALDVAEDVTGKDPGADVYSARDAEEAIWMAQSRAKCAAEREAQRSRS